MRLITTKDLADRWAMSESEIKCLVRGDSSLPFVRLGGGGDLRLNWRKVRFRLETVERWEEDHQQAFGADKPVVARLENHKVRRLRNWE